MNFSWAISLPCDATPALAPLRLLPGLEVAVHDQLIWLRGRTGGEHLSRLLRGLPAVERYELLPDNRLRRIESRIPSDRLPALEWHALNLWLGVELPPATVQTPIRAGMVASSPLRLARSGRELPAELLLTKFEDWESFALLAPEVRLRPLSFAMDAEGNVLVRGKPLPPLPGRRFVLSGNIAVPAGFTWEPAVSPEVVARLLGVPSEALVLFYEGGSWSRLEAEQFVPAIRGAARATSHVFSRP